MKNRYINRGGKLILEGKNRILKNKPQTYIPFIIIIFLNDLLQRKYVQHVQDTKIVPLTNFNTYIHNDLVM